MLKKCYCMNNEKNCSEDIFESKCDSVISYSDTNFNVCTCGFDEGNTIFPDNPMLGQSYVPIQYMDKTFKPCIGLKKGTIFPELVSPYFSGQSMKQIDYIRSTNIIGKGCNKC